MRVIHLYRESLLKLTASAEGAAVPAPKCKAEKNVLTPPIKQPRFDTRQFVLIADGNMTCHSNEDSSPLSSLLTQNKTHTTTNIQLCILLLSKL